MWGELIGIKVNPTVETGYMSWLYMLGKCQILWNLKAVICNIYIFIGVWRIQSAAILEHLIQRTSLIKKKKKLKGLDTSALIISY